MLGETGRAGQGVPRPNFFEDPVHGNGVVHVVHRPACYSECGQPCPKVCSLVAWWVQNFFHFMVPRPSLSSALGVYLIIVVVTVLNLAVGKQSLSHRPNRKENPSRTFKTPESKSVNISARHYRSHLYFRGSIIRLSAVCNGSFGIVTGVSVVNYM